MNATKLTLLAILALAGCEPSHVAEVAQQPTQATEQPATSSLPVITGKVIKIVDGDTIDILQAGNITTRIRCASYDAPETGQPFGKNAKQASLADLIAGEVIDVVIVDDDVDRWGRLIGEVMDDDGQRVAVKLVAAGLSWHFVKYAPNDTELAQAELNARAAKRGLWSDQRHVAPWNWRQLSKAERDKLR